MAATVDNAITKLQQLGSDGERWGYLPGLLTELAAKSDPLTLRVSTPGADGAADMDCGLFLLGSGIDLTGFSPKRVGQIVVIWCTASGTDPTVTCGAACTINAAGNNKMTFPDADDAMIMVAATLTRWNIILNVGSVTLTTV